MSKISEDYRKQGAMLMSASKYKQAQEQFMKALDEDADPETWKDLGHAYASNGEYKDAINAFTQALLMNPDDGEIHFDIGSVYLLQERLKKCIEYYNMAEEHGFNNARLYVNLAAIYEALGDKQLELRNYAKAIEKNPLLGDVYVKKALLLMDLGRPEAALETVYDLKKLFPDAFECYDLAARIYLAQGLYTKAEEILDEGIQKYPNDVNLKLSKIGYLIQFGKLDEAEAILESIKKQSNQELYEREVKLQEVSIASARGNTNKMIEILKQIIELEDGYCDEQARFMLMTIANVEGLYDIALEQADVLEQQENINSYTIAGLYYKADFLRKLGREGEAVQQYKKAARELRSITLSNRAPYEAYLYRALSHKELSEFEKAIEMAEFITDLKEDRPDGYLLLADIYKAMGDLQKSDEMFNIAQEKDPDLRRR